jgi:hypothetical protein
MLKPNDSSDNNGHTSPKTSSPWTKPPTAGSSGARTCIAGKRRGAVSSVFVITTQLLLVAFMIVTLLALDNDDNDGGHA